MKERDEVREWTFTDAMERAMLHVNSRILEIEIDSEKEEERVRENDRGERDKDRGGEREDEIDR